MPVSAGLHYFLHEGGGGLKPPFVLLHDVGGDHLSWPPEIRRLPDCRVFTLDLPGHGRSGGPGCQSIEEYARSIIGFIDSVGVSRAVFVGHSMGGAVALTLALDYPDRVAGICVISAGSRLSIPSSILENAGHPSTFPLAIKSLLGLSFGSQTSAGVKDMLSRRLLTTRPTLLLSDLLACDRFDVTDRLDAIYVPTLVVCGTDDKLTPLRFSKTLATRIPGAALQTIDGAGHMLVLEQPRRLVKLIGIFLTTISYVPGI